MSAIDAERLMRALPEDPRTRIAALSAGPGQPCEIVVGRGQW